jgi:MFS superfamily sulfate permease-like transporter
LAALIVVALIKKVFDVADFWKMFKKSKLDALAWLITFLGVVVFDVDIGLYVGLVSTLLLIILQSQRARTTIMGNIPGTNIFECVDTCQNALEYKNVKIIRYEESVYYANVDNFKYKILKLSGVKPSEVLAEIESDCKAKYRQLAKTVSKQKKLVKRKVSTGDLKFSEYTFDNVSLSY